MADRRPPWWMRAYLVGAFLSGVSVIVVSLLNLDREPWLSRLSHLLLGAVSVAFATFFFLAVDWRRQRRLKKRSLPPL